MAVSSLNLSVSLQAWHSAGLDFLLVDSTVNELMAALAAADSVRPQAGGATRPVMGLTGSGAPAAAGVEVRKSSAAMPARSQAPADEHIFSRKTSDATASVKQSSPHAFDPEHLPVLWSQVMRKVKPGPVVWIYPELGLDLLGLAVSGDKSAGPERGRVLRDIIGTLKLKRGTNTFWPASLPDADGKLRINRELFHGGLDYLGAKYLVVFGSHSLAGTDYGNIQLWPFSEQIVGGRMILSLPDFAALVQEQARLDSVAVFLHSIFARAFSNQGD